MRWALLLLVVSGCDLATRRGLCGERLAPWESARSVDGDDPDDACVVDTWEQGEVDLRDDRCEDDSDDCFVDPSVRITGDEVIFEYVDLDGVLHQARYLRED